MKKCLLLGIAVILLGGCPIHGPYYYDHDVTITLKDGVPCFGLADDAQLRSEQTEIYNIYVPHPENTIPQKSMMDKFMNHATLQSGECVPYEGEALENNVRYLIHFGHRLKNGEATKFIFTLDCSVFLKRKTVKKFSIILNIENGLHLAL